MNAIKRNVETLQKDINLQPWMVINNDQERHNKILGLPEIANQFDPISLQDMDTVALLNRIDTKFILTTRQLLNTLLNVENDYWMLSVNGKRLNHYRTLYFDTENFDLYHLHVNGRAERYKIRSREYTDSNLSFLEVKQKTSKGRTIKERIETEQMVAKMNQENISWINSILPESFQQLQPKLWNQFTRITLVGKHTAERVTLDMDLSYQDVSFPWKAKNIPMRNMAIAEVKTDSQNQSSPFLKIMKEQRIHPQGFSKYCIGAAMIYDQVKKNNLKPKFLRIQKLTGGIAFYE